MFVLVNIYIFSPIFRITVFSVDNGNKAKIKKAPKWKQSKMQFNERIKVNCNYFKHLKGFF